MSHFAFNVFIFMQNRNINKRDISSHKLVTVFFFVVVMLISYFLLWTGVALASGNGGLDISLAPKIVGTFLGLNITASMLSAWLTMMILITLAYYIGKKMKAVPTKIQSLFEIIVGGAYAYVLDVLEDKKKADRYFPIIMTIFIFIVSINWVGLLPGVASIGFFDENNSLIPFLYPSATDLNITIGFAIVSVITIQLSGILAMGAWKYGGKFLNLSSPLGFVIGIIEFFSEIARLVSFSFRLFGNIFAGKTLLVVVMFLAPYFLPVPIYAYEIFVGFIQAAIFAILTLFFIKLATEEPH